MINLNERWLGKCYWSGIFVMRVCLFLLLMIFAAVLTDIALRADETKAVEISAADKKFFEDEFFPVLKESCLRCHGEKKQSSGLRLDSRDNVLKGGQNGPAIVSGKPDESLIMKVLEHTGDIQMPPDAKLEDEKIAIFKKWIERDAPWPAEKKKE